MPIPSTIADLSTTASSNSPAGSDPPTDGDNYLRAIQAILKQADNDRIAADASLSALLATASTIAAGAGLIGYDASLSYTDGLGNFLNYTYGRTAAEVAAGVTPTYYYYPPGDVRRYGAVLDGVTDDTAALQRWASVDQPRFGRRGTAKVSGQITFAANTLNVDGGGMVIDASAGGTFTDSSVLYVSGSLTQISDLSVSPSANAVALTFSTDHTLSQNDVFIIYNPTDSSFNAARTYYRAGEYCRVNRAPTTATVQLWSPLYAAYTAANVDVYKMASTQVTIRNLTVIAPSSGAIRPIRIRLATRVRLDDVRAYGSGYVGIELDRCYDVEIRGSDLYQQPTTYSDEYGLSIGNCQNVRVIGGAYHAGRHCINIGGDDFAGVVPNRNVRVIGATLMNDQASASPAADIHGNCQDVEYQGCTIYGGASFGGLDNAYLNCTFFDAPLALNGLIVGGSECMGGSYRVENCRIKCSPAFSVGVIRGSNGASAAVADSHLIVRNITVEMGACDTFARFDMGTSSFKANACIENITFVSAPSLVNVCRMVGVGGAGDGDYVIVDKITGAPAGTLLYFAASSYGAAVKCRLMAQCGTAAITPASGAALANAASQTFRYSYGSKTPVCTVSLGSGTVNSKTVIGYPSSVSATAIIATMRTCDSTTMGVTSPDVTAYWTASVNEI